MAVRFLCCCILVVTMMVFPLVASERSSVHIVFTDRPMKEEPESYHLKTLAAVLGSDEAARKALVYSYKTAVSGFSAKLTPEQVDEISKLPGVINVTPSKTVQLHLTHGRRHA